MIKLHIDIVTLVLVQDGVPALTGGTGTPSEQEHRLELGL